MRGLTAKRQALIVVSTVVLAFGWSVSYAGEYHTGATLACQECHTMHFSQSHGFNANGGGIFTTLGGGGPHESLLRNEINALCLACHDGAAFAPDVLRTNTGATVRQAGALNSLNDAGPNYYEADGHTLGWTGVAPGGTFANADGLNCVDCHSPHGRSDGYRNLQTFGSFPNTIPPPTYVVGTNDLTKDVYLPAAKTRTVANTFFNEPDPTMSAYGTFCKNCHTDFHGAVGDVNIGGTGTPPEHFVRHPTAGVNIGAVGGGHSSAAVYASRANKVQTMSEDELWASVTDTDHDDNTPSCFSCHKSHGNKNAFGLIYMAGTGTVTEEGDDGSAYRDLCKQCHIQGG